MEGTANKSTAIGILAYICRGRKEGKEKGEGLGILEIGIGVGGVERAKLNQAC
jgi:hypothetical protein